ncbi:chemotaxis protein CheC [Aminiphilus sp.]|uniref:chemotaxis protein CheC n=1 Tax=Aminiphilus sp. TaxID=1872488 RepID=UPI0026129FF4|nr:chemotaxis protein CheC [Aminiphilus sp.]
MNDKTDAARLDAFRTDVLREICNIGAGNAATALSKLMNRRVDMRILRVLPLPFNDIVEYAGGAENIVAAVFARFEGSLSGNVLFAADEQEARHLILALTGTEQEGFSPLACSVIQEIGNILIGSYLTALSDFLGMELRPTVPSLAVDMAGAILSFSLMEIGRTSDTAIMIDACLGTEDAPPGEERTSRIFLLPDPESFETIFIALGVGDHGKD